MDEFFSGTVDSFSEAVVVLLVSLAIVAAVSLVVIATHEYVTGRKDGGYPVFAKLRKRIKLNRWIYKCGVKYSKNKIAKGGYR